MYATSAAAEPEAIAPSIIVKHRSHLAGTGTGQRGDTRDVIGRLIRQASPLTVSGLTTMARAQRSLARLLGNARGTLRELVIPTSDPTEPVPSLSSNEQDCNGGVSGVRIPHFSWAQRMLTNDSVRGVAVVALCGRIVDGLNLLQDF